MSSLRSWHPPYVRGINGIAVPFDYPGWQSRLSTGFEEMAMMRADGERNRAKVLDVAWHAFATEGLAVPIHEIARRAGVGTGTVSRHFPTKEALFEAVLLSRVQLIVDRAESLLDADDPGQAFFAFF